jgi:hypothetical protein
MELETVAGGKLTMDMAQTNPLITKACRIVGLSEKLESDTALSRQLRRKFV